MEPLLCFRVLLARKEYQAHQQNSSSHPIHFVLTLFWSFSIPLHFQDMFKITTAGQRSLQPSLLELLCSSGLGLPS